MTREIEIDGISIGGANPLFLIAGPCVIEDERSALDSALRLKEIAENLKMPFIFKSSYDKANRSSLDSYRGPGLKKGLDILGKIKKEVDVPILSDIHRFEEIAPAADVLDILQVPALLCRQTDMLLDVAKTGKVINIKKGQFMSPWDMKNVLDKITSTGNYDVILTERGTTFGYNNLVTDMRAFPVMRSFACPLVFDATHSVQLPGGKGVSSGGQREFVAPLARAAVATGIDGVFFEVHENPEKALCDGPNSLALDDLQNLLEGLQEIDSIVKKNIIGPAH